LKLIDVYKSLEQSRAWLLGTNVATNNSWQLRLYNMEFFLCCVILYTVTPWNVSRVDDNGDALIPLFLHCEFILDSVPCVKSPA